MIAITHVVSPCIDRCQLTFSERQPISYELAARQHEAYCRVLAANGDRVILLTANRTYPDGSFCEDTAIVLDEVAILMPMGTTSRRGEPAGIEPALAKHRPISRMAPPAMLEGGDVLRMDRKLFVGLSSRTNAEGIEQLRQTCRPLGYEVIPVSLSGCLHLKSACNALDSNTVLANPRWVDLAVFRDYDIVTVPEQEPFAANVLRWHDKVCLPAGFPRTVDCLHNRGINVQTVDISEIMKAEAGLTCMSLRFEEQSSKLS